MGRASTPPTIRLLVLAAGLTFGAGAASANGITDIKHTAFEDRLPVMFGTRSGVFIALADEIAFQDVCAGAGGEVTRVTMQRQGAGFPRTESFDFLSGLGVNAPCTTLIIPMRLRPQGQFIFRVEFADGTVLERRDVTLQPLEAALASSPSSPFVTDFDLLYGDKNGKLGVSFDLQADLRLIRIPLFETADEARLEFHGESAASGDSLSFKDAVTLDTRFSWLFGPVGSYYEVVANPIALEADDDFNTINYKGMVGVAARVPGTVRFGRTLQPLFGGCDQLAYNCTSDGLIIGVGYAANAKVKRESGKIDRSGDGLTTVEAKWRLPLHEGVTFNAGYAWQSDSPDGSSSESSEVGVTITPACAGVGIKISYINGEFMPGDQRRDAVRFGLTRLLGALKSNQGC